MAVSHGSVEVPNLKIEKKVFISYVGDTITYVGLNYLLRRKFGSPT